MLAEFDRNHFQPKRRHPMNQNYGFVEFYAKEKIDQMLAEASSQRQLPESKRELPTLVYLLSLVVVIAAVYFVL
jgi:hypothetical protein